MTSRGLVLVAGLAVALLAGCGESEDKRDQTTARDGTERKAPAANRAKRTDTRRNPRGIIPRGARRTRVVSVVDGDTIELAGVGRSRLIGVDTPEVYGESECYGREASAFTKDVLRAGRTVHYRRDIEPRDRYGRALVYVWLEDGRFFNALLAGRGYAQPLTIAPNVRYADLFVRLARRARSRTRGLWSRAACPGGEGRAGGGPSRRYRPSGGSDRDCGDFSSQREAQRYFEARGGPRRDPDRLDGNRDGVACEGLPR